MPLVSARYLLGAGGRALISRGFAQAGRPLDAPKLETLFARFLGYYNAHIADGSTLFPGVVASLDRFAAPRAGASRSAPTSSKPPLSCCLASSAIATASPSSAARTRSALASPTPSRFSRRSAKSAAGPSAR